MDEGRLLGDETEGADADLQLYCDGCHEPRTDTGGWGFVAYRSGAEIATGHGGQRGASNNAMELTALLDAMRWISRNAAGERTILWTDSAYAVTGCQQWRHIWRNWNWRKRSANSKGRSRPVPDAALWQAIDAELIKNALIAVAWCKGHVGIAGNERADRLAEDGRRRALT